MIIDSKEINVVLSTDRPLEVSFYKDTKADVLLSCTYIKSGQQEIQDYVENVSKPEITEFLIENAEPLVDKVITRESSNIIEEYVENTTKPEIEQFAQTQMAGFALRAESSANSAQASAELASSTAIAFEDVAVTETAKFNANAAEKQAAVEASATSATSAAAEAQASAISANASATSAAQSLASINDIAVTKADLDLSNIDQAGLGIIAHNAMPSDRYIKLALGATGSKYTAPADGYMYLRASIAWFAMTIRVDGAILMGFEFTDGSTDHGACFPIRKGQIAQVDYGGTASVQEFHFVYAEGAY